MAKGTEVVQTRSSRVVLLERAHQKGHHHPKEAQCRRRGHGQSLQNGNEAGRKAGLHYSQDHHDRTQWLAGDGEQGGQGGEEGEEAGAVDHSLCLQQPIVRRCGTDGFG